MGLYSPATRPLQHALSATSYKNWQSLTIGLNRVLSPVRLPVSPPGQGKNFHYHGIKLPQPPSGAFGKACGGEHLPQFALSRLQHTLPGAVRTAIWKNFGRTVAHQKSRILPSAGESWRTSLFAAPARTIPNSTFPGARALRDGVALHSLRARSGAEVRRRSNLRKQARRKQTQPQLRPPRRKTIRSEERRVGKE